MFYSGWDICARKERRDYFRCCFPGLGGSVDYLANPRLIVSQDDGKQMVVFRSAGADLTAGRDELKCIVWKRLIEGLCGIVSVGG